MGEAERFAIKESLRGLFTTFRMLRVDSQPRLIGITSSSQGEGRSTAVAIFATTLADLGLRVLVVDNVDLLLSSMVKTLSAWGCQVCAARNLVEAIDASGNLAIDLLISDYHLGDFEPNGLQLIQTMRSRAVRAIPALLMTGDVSAQLEAQAQLQDVRVVHKPVRPPVLRALVLALIEPTAQSQEPGQSPQAGKLD
jgi:CheY-like chemotaxis protein